MNLRLYLLIQIISVALICLVATTGYVLHQANRQARQESLMVANSLGNYLEAQLLQIEANIGQAKRFPDFDLWKQNHLQPGLCIRYRAVQQVDAYNLCQGSPINVRLWPQAFETLYRWLFAPDLPVERMVSVKAKAYGVITVLPNVDMVLAKAWNNIVGLLRLSASTVMAVCLLVTFSIYRALKPAEVIVKYLANKYYSNNQLPPFKLAEWQRIASAINEFSNTLQCLLSERKKLLTKLITLQEEERRYLARELHDDLGQCVAAGNAILAFLTQTAQEQCPQLLPELANISQINQNIMVTVRRLLLSLRPPELDELGLAACLNTLISEWNRQCAGKINFQLLINGDCQILPPPLPITLFRIVQEGLTNIAKHANATRAAVTLDIFKTQVNLAITDNGKAVALPTGKNSEMGLLGIRERVEGLGGQLHLAIVESGGLMLTVIIPIVPSPVDL
jgi:two-component system, NarL family, sensor histidine kinase UhpB